jgi:hypothetical protein
MATGSSWPSVARSSFLALPQTRAAACCLGGGLLCSSLGRFCSCSAGHFSFVSAQQPQTRAAACLSRPGTVPHQLQVQHSRPSSGCDSVPSVTLRFANYLAAVCLGSKRAFTAADHAFTRQGQHHLQVQGRRPAKTAIYKMVCPSFHCT